MADRNAAAIFAKVFEACADEKDSEASIRIAKTMWAEMNEYDFTEDQMGCNAVLMELGFAKKGVGTEEGSILYLKKDGEYR